MRNPRTLFAALACLLFALLVFVVRVNGQAVSACDLDLTSLYVLQTDADVSAEGVALANEWTYGAGYRNASGRPEYMLYGNAEAPKAERRYLLIYGTSDPDTVVVFDYSFTRLFGRNTPQELRNHPDCQSGTLSRVDLDAVLNG